MKDMDRISLLPDCLLHEILSFLNTKSVVQTCVLSKRWKTLWTDIPTLNFDFGSYPLEGSTTISPLSNQCSVKRFICRFLSQHRTKFIKKLSFSSSIHTHEAVLIVDLLLCYARHHTVQELCLHTFNTKYCELPFGLSKCSSLTVLKMKRVNMDEWCLIKLPFVRILEVEYDWTNLFPNSLFEKAQSFSGFPNLESLVLVNNLFEYYSITAPKLENLELSVSSEWELSFPQVTLLTPILKSVKFSNMLPTVKTASEFSCIDQVNIAVDDSDFGGDSSAMQELKVRISELLRVFHNARSFTLPLKAIEVLLSGPSSLSGVSFHNLRYLKLKTEATNQMKSLPISTLMNSLNCPNLEKLEVETNQE